MSVEFDRGSPRKCDSRTLNRRTLDRWTGRNVKVGGQDYNLAFAPPKAPRKITIL